MIKKISVTIFFLITLLITGCVKEVPPVLNPSSTEVVMSNMQGTGTLNITSNSKWTATSTSSWFTISPSSGNGDGIITINAQNNLTNFERSAIITLVTGQVGNTNYLKKTVTVKQGFPQISVDNDLVSFEKDAGSKVVKVTANTQWTLQIPTGTSWVTTNTLSGSTSADLTFIAQANTAGDRNVKVTFTFGDTTKCITIFQKRAVNANPTSIQPLSPSNLSVNTSRLIFFTWTPSSDTDNDRVTYTFDLSDNTGFLSGDGKYLKVF